MKPIVNYKVSCILLVLFLVSGCLPVIFTGAAGSALELAKDRKAGDALSDVRISSAIKAEFIKKNFRELYAKIKVEVVVGRVLLTGTIDKEEDAITAVQIAWDQEGVTEVINELKVDKNSSTFNLVQYTRDALITSQIKSKTFMNRDIKFVNFTVVTINDVVYLFGIARSEDELTKVAEIAANIHGVQKVVSHVKVNPLASTTQTTAASKDNEKDDYIIYNNEDSSGVTQVSGDGW
ncbi:MAG: BON domain-containing protein [Rickettsiaceae bacterium]